MTLQFGLLRSRVAQRIFGLFVFSALIPIGVTAIVAFFHVSDVLSRQKEEQLRHLGKHYGMAILDRLLTVEARAREIVSKHPNEKLMFSDDTNEILKRYFRAIALVRDSGDAVPILGKRQHWPISVGSSEKLDKSRISVISHATRSAPSASIFMSLAIVTDGAEQGLIVAELKADYLWGDEDELPPMIDMCVLGAQEQMLFCSRPMSAEVLTKIAVQLNQVNSDLLAWEDSGQKYLGTQWQLFLAPMFTYPKWTIVVSQAKSYALAPIAAFSRIFLTAILLSSLLVVFLSLSQIRKSLVPLEKLIKGTRHLANEDFSKLVKITSDDEFGKLGRSFNAMAIRLGKSFNTLDTLSQIDRLLLSKPDFEQIVNMVLKHIRDILNCDFTSITVIGLDSSTPAQSYIKDHYRDSEPRFETLVLAPQEIQTLLASPQPLLLNAEIAQRGFLEFLPSLGANSVWVFPIVYKQRLSGIMALGYRESPSLGKNDMLRARDLTDRIAVALSVAEREKRLYQQAHYDALTGLPNRQLLIERLNREISYSQRYHDLIALLFIDLDRFKNVNDSMGHAAGDQLLEQAAARLLRCVRETDTVARLGGDEFTIILSGIGKPRDAGCVAEDIIKCLSEPFTIEHQSHFVSASIGVTLYPNDGRTSGELLRNADTAMYRAKHSGRCCYLFFKEEMNTEAVERTTLECDLRRALDGDEFVLYYHPQLDLRTGAITAAEVLIRWHHPERGLIPPGAFVTIAEDTGLIGPIGEWVLENACRQHKSWRTEGIPLERLAVNVSSIQFKQRDFADRVRSILTSTGLPPHCLELEITESLFMENTKHLAHTLEQLHVLGLRLAIDDFGTGYSSLSYLSRFPVDTLKVDRSFLWNVPTDKIAANILKSIITLVRNLQKEIIVEGVETREQMTFLHTHNCQQVQGFYLSRPVPADEFVRFINRHSVSTPIRAQLEITEDS